jgi:hypothetical protein
MADAFISSPTTGLLQYNDAVSPVMTSAELINDGHQLLVDGYGQYYLKDGHAYVDDEPFSQPDRELDVAATIEFTNGTSVALTASDIISFRSTMDIGSGFPYMQTPVGKYTLVLNNADRRWDAGSTYLGTATLDGAVVSLSVGAKNEIDVYQYSDFGVFIIDTVDNQDHMTTVTVSGNDFMGNRALTPYVDFTAGEYEIVMEGGDEVGGVTFDMIMARACSQAGVTYESGWSAIKNTKYRGFPWKPTLPADVTCRDVFGWLAAIAYRGSGSTRYNAMFNPSGVLVYRSKATHVVPRSQYFTLTGNMPYRVETHAELTATYTYGSENEYVVKDTDVPESTEVAFYSQYYEFAIDMCPWWIENDVPEDEETEQIAFLNDFLDTIRGRTGAVLDWVGRPNCLVGDELSVQRRDGNTALVPILQQEITFGPGLRFTSGCDFSAYTEHDIYSGTWKA